MWEGRRLMVFLRDIAMQMNEVGRDSSSKRVEGVLPILIDLNVL